MKSTRGRTLRRVASNALPLGKGGAGGVGTSGGGRSPSGAPSSSILRLAFGRLAKGFVFRVAVTPPNPPLRKGGSYGRFASLERKRAGLTLFEVMLALVIFVGSMAAIGQLVSNGVRGALRARLETQAAMMADAKMGEVVAGAVPLNSVQQTYPDDPKWSWNLIVTAGPVQGLMRAQVTVTHQASTAKGTVSFTLARYVRDPQIYYAAEAEAERNAQEQQESEQK